MPAPRSPAPTARAGRARAARWEHRGYARAERCSQIAAARSDDWGMGRVEPGSVATKIAGMGSVAAVAGSRARTGGGRHRRLVGATSRHRGVGADADAPQELAERGRLEGADARFEFVAGYGRKP